MTTNLTTPKHRALLGIIKSTLAGAYFPALLLLLAAPSGQAGSATWLANPGTGNWNTATNWTPATIPNGASDTATFSVSSTPAVAVTSITTVDGIFFDSGASPYAITNNIKFSLTGSGVINNSGITQNFVAQPNGFSSNGELDFHNSATAGTLTFYTLAATNEFGTGSIVIFDGTSSAGNATFLLEGSFINTDSSAYPGAVALFNANATLDNASFALAGGDVARANGGQLKCASTMNTPIRGNFNVGGGAVADAFGALIEFDKFGSVLADVNSTFAVGGGLAAGATGGLLDFHAVSVRSINSTFIVESGAVAGAGGGTALFRPQSVTGFGSSNATIYGGGVAGALGGYMECDKFDLGNGTYTVNGGRGSGATGGSLYFNDTPGVKGTLIAKDGLRHGAGGAIYIRTSALGGLPAIEVFGNGSVDFSGWSAAGRTVRSIKGTGVIFLGGGPLLVGRNNLDTTFSGSLRDGGLSGGTLGALTKVGNGILTLSGASSYTGGTAVTAGTLLVSNVAGSGTGTSVVSVIAGTLGGRGTVAGAVRVGNGSGPGAFLSPGDAGLGTLTIRRALTLNRNATYYCELDSNSASADQVVARGVQINNNAMIVLMDVGSGTLAPGTAFTVIDNTAATPIAGTFGNLADGSSFSIGNNTYFVNYSGGDGNDLNVTVQ